MKVVIILTVVLCFTLPGYYAILEIEPANFETQSEILEVPESSAMPTVQTRGEIVELPESRAISTVHLKSKSMNSLASSSDSKVNTKSLFKNSGIRRSSTLPGRAAHQRVTSYPETILEVQDETDSTKAIDEEQPTQEPVPPKKKNILRVFSREKIDTTSYTSTVSDRMTISSITSKLKEIYASRDALFTLQKKYILSGSTQDLKSGIDAVKRFQKDLSEMKDFAFYEDYLKEAQQTLKWFQRQSRQFSSISKESSLQIKSYLTIIDTIDERLKLFVRNIGFKDKLTLKKAYDDTQRKIELIDRLPDDLPLKSYLKSKALRFDEWLKEGASIQKLPTI